MADFDDEFLDVDFLDPSNWPDDCKINGEPCYGDRGGTFSLSCGEYEAAEPLLAWNEIEAAIEMLDANPEQGLDWLVVWILNQLKEGSCVGNMGAQGLMNLLAQMFGKDAIPLLTAISLYKQIGRSPSSGANVSDCMQALRDTGVLPLDTPANRAKYGSHVMPATGFHTPFPSGWKETAKNFRGAEFLTIRSTQGIFSALCRGHRVGVGREGHSILYLRPMKGRKVKYVNSWGQWGTSGGGLSKGFGIDSQRQVEKSGSWAFAIRAGTIPQTLAA